MPRFSRVLPLILWLCLALPTLAAAAENSSAKAPAVESATPPAPEQKASPHDSDYEMYKLLADTIDQVERNYITEVKRRDLIEAAIRGVLGRLDPYSSYIGPDELGRFRTTVENEFGGIGIQISIDDDELRVLSPMYGTPAYRAGVLAGDRIVEIDGKSTDGLTSDEAIERLKGDEGTAVTLTVIHPGREDREKISVTRERIHVETVLGDHRKPDNTWDFMHDPAQRIGYVRLTVFGRDTAAQLRDVLTRLHADQMRGLILDLRFNPGGLLESAIEVSNLFISAGRIVSTKGRNTPERHWDAHQDGVFEGFPMAVLVNHYSASASEIVAACLQDHQRAVVVGERTWGKGSVQNVVELENRKSALKLTTASYRRPSGKNIHRFPGAKESDEWGVMPDQGFEVKLNDKDKDEMRKLVEDRKARDILKPVDNNGNGAKSEPPAKNAESAAKNGSQPFVDRQLEAAVKYLHAELAKAQ